MRTPLELPGPSVTVSWLEERLGAADLVVLDGSWYLPGMDRDAREEFCERRIPGARFFDIDRCSDPNSELPHTVASPEHFCACAEEVGVSDGSTVVVYDGSGVNLSAARVWWNFRYFGFDRIAVLDGGLGRWLWGGKPIESGEPFRTLEVPATFTPRPRPELICTREDVLKMIAQCGTGGVQIVDVRPAGRFVGDDPEPRSGLRRGHIPGSRNLPFTELVDGDTGLALSREELSELLRDAELSGERQVVATCGSGTSACALAWNLARLGRSDVAIYDGSWAEWGSRNDLPVAVGPSC